VSARNTYWQMQLKALKVAHSMNCPVAGAARLEGSPSGPRRPSACNLLPLASSAKLSLATVLGPNLTKTFPINLERIGTRNH